MYNPKESILIVGIVKDIAKTIHEDIKLMNESFMDFSTVSWFLVESDSNDNSVQILNELEISMSNFSFLSLGKLERDFPDRTVRLAYARNRYLDAIRSSPQYSDFQYIAVADFNSLNSKLTKAAVDSCWSRNTWDVCTANQDGRYYDVWALRHHLWSPNDCWEQLEFLKRYSKVPEFALYVSLNSRMIKLPQDSDWIEVESAFGGLAIYRREALLSGSYSGKNALGKPICEHVTLHEQISEKGFKIFINPKLINCKKTDHSIRASLRYVIARNLLNIVNLRKLRNYFVNPEKASLS
jgi:hypothetical protein